MFFIWLIFAAIAINQIARILTSVDLLEAPRDYFAKKFPKIAKLATCVFCQSFWLSGIVAYFSLPIWPIAFAVPGVLQLVLTWFVLHSVAEIVNEFKERYLNRAPQTIYAQMDHKISNSSPSAETE